jgi:hypothetical protein
MNLKMRLLAISLGTSLLCGLAPAWSQQPAATASTGGAKQDMKNAGTETKNAAKDAGNGVKKGTKKAYDSTKSGTKKAVNKTKSTTKGAVNGAKEGAKQPQ